MGVAVFNMKQLQSAQVETSFIDITFSHIR